MVNLFAISSTLPSEIKNQLGLVLLELIAFEIIVKFGMITSSFFLIPIAFNAISKAEKYLKQLQNSFLFFTETFFQ